MIAKKVDAENVCAFEIYDGPNVVAFVSCCGELTRDAILATLAMGGIPEG